MKHNNKYILDSNAYNEAVSIDDTDARLIRILSDQKALKEAGAKKGRKQGETFKLNNKEYIIEAAENNFLTGFSGAIVRDVQENKVILWVDG